MELVAHGFKENKKGNNGVLLMSKVLNDFRKKIVSKSSRAGEPRTYWDPKN